MGAIRVMSSVTFMKRKARQYAREDYPDYQHYKIKEINYKEQYIVISIEGFDGSKQLVQYNF